MDFGGSVAAVHDPDAEWNDLTDLCAIGGDPLVGSEEEAGVMLEELYSCFATH